MPLQPLAKPTTFDLDQAFAMEPERARQCSVSAAGLTLQYCRERIYAAELDALLASGQGWEQQRDAMFRGERINRSENRAVGHIALRAPASSVFAPDGHNVMPEVEAERARQRQFAQSIRTGGEITSLLHIGIGGSDLGPRLLCEVLPVDGPQPSFVANVDAHEIHAVLAKLDAKRTLVLVASKTFTTLETLTNASIARDWLRRGGGDATKQMVALTANPSAAEQWGIAAAQVFKFWDWVGGRYSLWSSVSLVVRIACGNQAFEQLLGGARQMDEHFVSQPVAQNLPALAAHLDYWNRLQLGIPTRMLAAYDARLALLVPYLQQLSMESLGKQVDSEAKPLDHASSPVLWGDIGTNAQHAFFQQLHQGDQTVACELIGTVQADHPYAQSHVALHANLLAQAEVLARGYSAQQITASLAQGQTAERVTERVCRGHHPVSLLWLQRLTPATLGSLLAYWEHRTLVFGYLLQVNPFDQWGVERGKQMTRLLEPALQGGGTQALNPESAAAVDFLRNA